MVSTGIEANHGSSKHRANVQEKLGWLLLAAVGVLLLSITAMLVAFLLPIQKVNSLGSLSEFMPSDVPYKVYIQGKNPTMDWVFVVNIEGKLMALSPITPNSTHCRIVWEKANHRFADPCGGAKFALNGGYLEGPAWGNMGIYPIGMTDSAKLYIDSNQVEVENREQFLTRCLAGLKLGAYLASDSQDVGRCGTAIAPANIQTIFTK